ncbi:phosphoribosylamine--glycine ligase [Nesterenkonia sp. MY13]|uniref:Multifunctional fusion protein n=1 Tax=Nesterenkonia sedimenti TaxID=1463632 RepID=A0A7X8YEY5_9MICC|nr:phosphoribosylamine--glycine ligase [Nesterenkonia sedimenti]NLS10975.1 phosphoribosylamine--glycine ligase [Nesterenkonia sedimenti]
MKILVVGPGGREHAIIRALNRDAAVSTVHAAPGNAGIAADAECFAVDASDPDTVAALASEGGYDLVVVGPEAPLAAGVSDAVRAAGIPVFGPSQAAAQLEASKAFAKEIMTAAGVPTAESVHTTTPAEAITALSHFGPPYVVKDDGLAAGKGVVVTEDREAAIAHAVACQSGGSVVIEEFLDGPEVSLFVISDGENLVPLSPAQDFKRIHDGDAGPNTGGMGAYTPLDWLEDYTETGPDGLTRNFTEVVMDRVARPTVQEMARRGTPFTGVLYCGLAVTSRGVRVVEFNVRFGDPETQAVLERLATPLGGLLLDAATGNLGPDRQLEWTRGYAADVVIAAENYPDSPRKGDVISGLKKASSLDDVAVLHAGTKTNDDGDYLTAGGRVLAVVGTGDSLQAAVDRAYAGVAEISWPGAQHRSDIAAKALRGEIKVTAQLPGWSHVASGKVRELYEPAPGSAWDGEDVLLMVATDRVSAYDHVLSPGIPGKGTILTQLSLWWFEQLAAEGIGNHVVSTDVPQEVAGRGLIVRRLEMVQAEAIVRGYLTGSGLTEYGSTGSVTGIPLPEGLADGSRLPEPIFTPSSKAEYGEHDVNITYAQLEDKIGAGLAERVRCTSMRIYEVAEQKAREAGIVLADTKFEFGLSPEGDLVLADEVLTPDSSRFWPADQWEPGKAQPSFDKQFVRDWLTNESGWNRDSGVTPPPLPDHIVAATRDRYMEAYRKLTGTDLSL